MTPRQLKHYREHFREAIREDGVVCLECGTLHSFLPLHLRLKHRMTAHDYRAKWGYNRTTALVTPALSEGRRMRMRAQVSVARPPRDSIRRAIAANRGAKRPARLERRLDQSARSRALGLRPPPPPTKVDDNALRRLVAEGLTFRQLAARMGLPRNTVWQRVRRLGLRGPGIGPPRRLKATDAELLALRRNGLWPKEIAARTGMTVSAVRARMGQLRRRGISLPAPSRPRPNAMRKASDVGILAGIRAGLGPSKLAPRLGLSLSGLDKRLSRLRRRGLLRPPQRPKTESVPDATLLDLRKVGLGSRDIAARTGMAQITVWRRFARLRRRGVSVPPPGGAARAVSDASVLALAQTGLGTGKIAARVGLRPRTVRTRLASLRRRGLLPSPTRPGPSAPAAHRVGVSDEQILCLRQEGLWPQQIASRLGITSSAVGYHLGKLRRQGVPIPRPAGPLPNRRRRVSDEQLLELVRAGLRTREIAARVGLAQVSVWHRLNALRRRGLLHGWPPPRHNAAEVMAHRQAGLSNREIAARLGITIRTVESHLARLRRQGLSVPTLPASRVSDDELMALVREGGRSRDIAARVGLTTGRVSDRLARLRKRGILDLPWWQPPHRFTDEELVDLVGKGHGPPEIARKFAVTREAVYRRIRGLRERGLLPPTAPPGAAPLPHPAEDPV